MNAPLTMRWYRELPDGSVVCYGIDDMPDDLWDKRWSQRSYVGDYAVSSVFLVIDHGWGKGVPLLWETMVFHNGNDLEQERFTTRNACEMFHFEMVCKYTEIAVREALKTKEK